MENKKGFSGILGIVIIAIVGCILFSPWFYLKYMVVLSKDKIIYETNLQRMANGLPILNENKKLNEIAEAKVYDMFRNQYFEHISPDGVAPEQLALSYGYDYSFHGENLILGNFFTEKKIVQNWMNSPDHRKNILNENFTEIGVSFIKENYKGKIVWIGVQEFGSPR